MIEPTIKIDVPVPSRGGGNGRPVSTKWEFLHNLEVGESAHFDELEFPSDEEFKKFKKSLSSVASSHGRSADKKFAVRTTDSGVGVWRIA